MPHEDDEDTYAFGQDVSGFMTNEPMRREEHYVRRQDLYIPPENRPPTDGKVYETEETELWDTTSDYHSLPPRSDRYNVGHMIEQHIRLKILHFVVLDLRLSSLLPQSTTSSCPNVIISQKKAGADETQNCQTQESTDQTLASIQH